MGALGKKSKLPEDSTRDLPGKMHFKLGEKEIQMGSYKNEWDRQHYIREKEVRLVAVTF